MKATDDKAMPRRTDRRVCAACGASPAGCDGVKWLRGRWCCEQCTGDHDAKGASDAA